MDYREMDYREQARMIEQRYRIVGGIFSFALLGGLNILVGALLHAVVVGVIGAIFLAAGLAFSVALWVAEHSVRS